MLPQWPPTRAGLLQPKGLLTTVDDLLQQGIAALKAGHKPAARALLARALRRDGQNETAWLWLSGAVETDEERRRCLLRVLEINPDNELARRGLEALPGQPAGPRAAAAAPPAAAAADGGTQDRQSRMLITIGAVMVVAACILAIFILAAGVGQEVPNVGPLYETPYVIVYGRQDCAICRGLMDDLESRGIPYTSKSVDLNAVQQELHPRMRQAGLDTSSYGLPVVDVSGALMIQPSASTVARLYGSS